MSSRRLLLTTIFTFVTLAISAQTIHWITFFDTEDVNVGEMDRNGRQVLYSRLVNVINADLSMIGYKVNVNDFFGSQCTSANCVKVVKELKCTPSDIVVFYYVGHGFHAVNDVTDYPTMVFKENAITEKAVPLSWVHHELKDKGAQLVITICGGSNIDTGTQIVTQTASIPIPNTRQITNKLLYQTSELSAIQKAFMCNKGSIILSAASHGQAAYGGPTPLGNMDMLSAALITCFEDMIYEKRFTWDGFLSEISSVVKEATDGKQVPLYNYELTEALKSE